jgi:hypothetical protein
MLALKVVFSRPRIFNKMSWNFELQRRISFVQKLREANQTTIGILIFVISMQFLFLFLFLLFQ